MSVTQYVQISKDENVKASVQTVAGARGGCHWINMMIGDAYLQFLIVESSLEDAQAIADAFNKAIGNTAKKD